MIYVVGSAGFLFGFLLAWFLLRVRYDAHKSTVWAESNEEGVELRSFSSDALGRVRRALDGERSYTIMRITRPE